MRDTILNGAEKTVVTNSRLMNNPLKNFIKGRKTETSISTEIEPDKLKEKTEILKRSAEENERILEKTGPKINLNGIGEKVSAEPHYWIKDPSTSNRSEAKYWKNTTGKQKEKDS